MTRRLGSMILVALVFLSSGIRAQESASSGIVGQVVDSTKGAMPGATVTVINTGTNAQRVAVTDGEGRFSIPNLPPATYQIRVELSGFQTTEIKAFTLRNGDIARPTITLGLANVSETVTVVGESPLAADAKRVGRPEHLAEADQRSARQRTHAAVLRRALRGRDAAGLQPRHAVRRRREQPQRVRDRGGWPRQFDQLHRRRRLRAVAALQQPVAGAAGRRRHGSQPAAQLLLDRVRAGPGGRVDRHQVGLEQAVGLGVGILPRRSIRQEELLRRDQAGTEAQPVQRDQRRPDQAQQGVRVRVV